MSETKNVRAAKPITSATVVGWGIGVLSLTLFLAAQRAPGAVESLYSRAIYPSIASTLAWCFAWVPFSVGELVLIVIPIVVLWGVIAGWRAGRRAGWGLPWSSIAAIGRGVARVSVVWFLFLVCWGLNYSRWQPEMLFQLEPPQDSIQTEQLIESIGRHLDELRGGLAQDDQGVALMPGDLGTRFATAAGAGRTARRAEASYDRCRPGQAVRVEPAVASLGREWDVRPVHRRTAVGIAGSADAVALHVGARARSSLGIRVGGSGQLHRLAHLLAQRRSACAVLRLVVALDLAAPRIRKPRAWSPARSARHFEVRARTPWSRSAHILARLQRVSVGPWCEGGTRSYGRVAGLALAWLSKHGVPNG